MFTIPTIVSSDDLKVRAYVTFYFNNERKREYNGSKIGLRLSPNKANDVHKRTELLEQLRFQIHKALEDGNYPLKFQLANSTVNTISVTVTKCIENNAIELLFKAVKSKIRSNLSKKYKRNLKAVYRKFRDYLTPEELNGSLDLIRLHRIETFLAQFNSSGTYYMNKRRDLGVLFTAAGRIIDQPTEIIQKTSRRKPKAKLHMTYEKEQLKPIFSYLKINHPKLYVCCLLTYGSWLRPHEEVRLLTAENFRKDCSEVILSGNENKGGKVRVVYIPEYIRVELESTLSQINRQDNIFSLDSKPFNESYFNTQWSRAWKKMFTLGLIYENQTIYSFRHTAAVDLYRRTKDVYLLQKLLGHSSIVVTLKYLRSLGELNISELKDAAPQL